ncbi:hypothetical protein SPRG_10493 [Saprolegnia parasitica CBS 223.65]|uniref:B box-type domain-containing protein n=1 Tax=Saprolegnia parasitica (strain CBS 223.65) TaxID=695850 RepID=A0A067C3N4_SAPPC|nr:hypothetical protein SPRG_10493 [Saprolegnia parasitica CBS 223.65]KDO23715.1 hypothetical protein SPRG_10493 [Saprolegnia parasitica CBS 223.65]|eukprot:XP_012205533.1 hypothetical protein SPRG_10493 [Saprolegnia parasitica CBS 223.65]
MDEVDEDEVRRQVAVALYRHEKGRALALKKQRDIRRAAALQTAKLRRREAACCSEMAAEDTASRAAQAYYFGLLRAEAEKRKYDEEQKVLQLVSAARKTAKSAGAVLSTPGARGLERLEVLRQRTATIERDAELRRTMRPPGLHLEALRVRTLLAAHGTDHAIECLERAIHEQHWPEMLHLLATTPRLSADFETSTGYTPLVMALCHCKPSIARTLLSKHGASPHRETSDGKTPLLAAIWGNDVDGLRLLVQDFGANVRAESTHYVTPLLFAIEKGRLACVQQLLAFGADPNDANVEGTTPLIAATLAQQMDAIEVLVAAGARWEIRGKDDRTALEWAIRCQFHAFHDRLELLRFRPPTQSTDRDAARRLRERRADTAIASRDVESLLGMVRRGEVSPNFEGQAHCTPMLAVSRMGTLAQLQSLLALGGLPNQPNQLGQTPLLSACERGHGDMLICLVNVGATFAYCDFRGHDAFTHLKEFPDLVSQWTPYRRQFTTALTLGTPSRLATSSVPHPFGMRTELRPESADILRVATPQLQSPPEDPDVLDANTQHKWQLQQTGLRQRPGKRRVFEEERHKVLKARQAPRRNALAVVQPDPETVARPLCGNCVLVRATAYCQECRLAYCDKCVMERHIDADARHHSTGPITPEDICRVKPPKPSDPPEAQPLSKSVNQSLDAIAALRTLLSASCEPSRAMTPDMDPEIKLRLLRDRREDERRRREAHLTLNVPQVAASTAAAQGSSLFSKPSEIRLARTYTQQGKFTKAEAVLLDAYNMQVASFGATHPLVGKTLYEMGVVSSAKGETRESSAKLLESIACFEQHLPLDHNDLLQSTKALFECWSNGREWGLCAAFAKGLSIQRRDALGPEHPLTLEAIALRASYDAQWELQLMLREDARGQRLLDIATNGASYVDAAQGRRHSQFFKLLTSPKTEDVQRFVRYADTTLYAVYIEFWLAVHGFHVACDAKAPGFQPYIAARDLFKAFLKTQRIKCTTATLRNEIRQCLRGETKETKPIRDIFNCVFDLVFQTTWKSVYLPYLQTPDGMAWHEAEHKAAIDEYNDLVASGLLEPRTSPLG